MTADSDFLLNLLTLGCPLVRSHPVERAMAALAYLGHGVVDLAIASGIIAYGIVARNRRARQAGLAALLAVLAAGLLADLLKLVFRTPRPAAWGYGFPSGHTSTAFALAVTLGRVVPPAAPFLYLLALLVGVARIYERSHSVIDVLGGALLGTTTAIMVCRKVLGLPGAAAKGAPWRWAWVIPLSLGALAFGFFAAYEGALAAHHPSPASLAGKAPRLVITFGTPESRAFLLEGWAKAEHREETFARVWAQGKESTLRLPPLSPAERYRIRFKARPYAETGGRALCQVVEVAVNGVPAGRLLLEKDWDEYEFPVSRTLIGQGANEIRFRFSPSQEPAGRAPSAALASLQVFADPK